MDSNDAGFPFIKPWARYLITFPSLSFVLFCFFLNGNSLCLMGCYEKTCKKQSVQWMFGTQQSMLLATETFFRGQDGVTKRIGFEIRLVYESWLCYFLIKITTMNI